jgi:transposase
MKELFNDVFTLPISEGGIHYLLNRFAEKSNATYQNIKERIASSTVIGADETGVKVNGNKHWFWTWQTNKLTYITHSENRGSATITSHFPQGFKNSTLVHDGWKPQLNTPAKHHQTCLPHLLRHLTYLNEKYPNTTWGKQFIKLLYDALQLSKKTKPQALERSKIIAQLDQILDQPPDKNHKELYTFYKRMCREKQHLFTFLFIDEVPADNNASERAIRNVKVKQKISGQFKTNKAAQNFAKIRSVIDTSIKNRCNVLQALITIAKFSNQIVTD